MVDLSESDREQFDRLRERLEGVSREEPSGRGRLTEHQSLDPMLAQPHDGSLDDLDESSWYAEPKYDGTRILLQKFDGRVALYTRRHIDRADAVPVVTTAASDHLPDGVVVDGEFTFLDADGGSYFIPIHTAVEKRASLTPRFFAFDLLVDDCEWILRDPLSDRKDRLERVFHAAPDSLEVVEPRTADFTDFYEELVERGEEGIMLKRRRSPYHLDTRSRHWRKVKAFDEVDVLVVGYTPGEGRRASTFGALVLCDPDGYVGKVGSGFDRETLESVADLLEPTEDRRIPRSVVGKAYVPVEPLVATVRVMEVTDTRKLRAPVFVRLRPETPPESLEPVEGQAR